MPTNGMIDAAAARRYRPHYWAVRLLSAIRRRPPGWLQTPLLHLSGRIINDLLRRERRRQGIPSGRR